jgi:hypothetical protein
MDIAICHIQWQPCYRIVPSRFPPIALFENVADPADLDAVFAIEAMTNDRLRQDAGELALAPPEDRVSGPGSTPSWLHSPTSIRLAIASPTALMASSTPAKISPRPLPKAAVGHRLEDRHNLLTVMAAEVYDRGPRSSRSGQPPALGA